MNSDITFKSVAYGAQFAFWYALNIAPVVILAYIAVHFVAKYW